MSKYFNSYVYCMWSFGNWYSLHLIPGIELCWNARLASIHIEISWLVWEWNTNIFTRPVVVDMPMFAAEEVDFDGE